MVNLATARSICITLIVVGALAGSGPHGTSGQFVDDHDGNATFEAADTFHGNNGNNPPASNKVYNDVNNNGEYDEDDEMIHVQELDDYDNPDANLVLSSNVDEVDMDDDPVSIRAGNITSEVDVTSDTDDVTLEATDGDVNLPGRTIAAPNGTVKIRASGHVNLDGATIEAEDGPIVVEAQSISAENAELWTQNGDVVLSAQRNGGSELVATGASLNATGDGALALGSNGDMLLDGADLRSQNGDVTANLTRNDTTLYVDGTDIDDGDDALEYEPSEVEVDGSSEDDTEPL